MKFGAGFVSHPAAAIASARLLLLPLDAGFLEASLVGDRYRARLEAAVAAEWWDETALMELRLADLRTDPKLLPWLLRAVVLRSEQRMIGHAGFHGPPGADYLSEFAPGGAELGYTIYPAFRNRGFATEAAAALMDWAHEHEGVSRFVMSIRPDNLPSLRIARRLGFEKRGSHIDEVDGLEEIFVRERVPVS